MSEITKVLNLPIGTIVDFSQYRGSGVSIYIEKFFQKFKIICSRVGLHREFFNVNVFDLCEDVDDGCLEVGNNYMSYSSTYKNDLFVFILCEERDYLKIKMLYDDYDTGLTPDVFGLTL